jgi:hypothetical protein
MPTNRTRRMRKRKGGSVASPEVISLLSHDNLRGIAVLLLRMNGEVAGRKTVDELVADGPELWKRFREEALASCIERFPGTRPELWWKENGPRPEVPGDDARERVIADLRFLRERKYISPEEDERVVTFWRRRGQQL